MRFKMLSIIGVIGLMGASGALALSQAASAGVTSQVVAVSACRPGQLTMRVGPEVSEKTQQETSIFVVRNTSAKACRLDGYPVVSLFTAHGKVLPFRYRDHGDQMLTGARPHLVVLAPGDRGYFGINMNACVLRPAATGSYLAAFPPNQMIGLRGSVDYCASNDPAGHMVDISPFEKTVQALLAS